MGWLYIVININIKGMATYRNKTTGVIQEFPDNYVFEKYGDVWELVTELPSPLSALSTQVGGSHYKDFKIQPVEFIHKNGIGFIEGCCIKYLCRWRSKNGVEDLKKAKHFIDMLIEMEEKKC